VGAIANIPRAPAHLTAESRSLWTEVVGDYRLEVSVVLNQLVPDESRCAAKLSLLLRERGLRRSVIPATLEEPGREERDRSAE